MEPMDLKYISYAITVARCGSVTQAAKKLYMAQPNLSRSIGELEQALGFPLFVRTRQGMVPTVQGERFLSEAEAMLESLTALAQECRRQKHSEAHFVCVPSSLFINIVLGAARLAPEWSIQCQEYYDCTELFECVENGSALAAFLTFGSDMKEKLLAYFARKNLSYHFLAQSPAYGVVRKDSHLYSPGPASPSIRYEEATLMLSVDYFDPIGIPFDQEKNSLPRAKGIRHGIGRAGNLDMLGSIDDLVMISCHVHSKIMERNHLVAVPLRPEITAYEYGYVTKENAPIGAEERRLLELIEKEVRKELDYS